MGCCYDLTETPPYGPWIEALAGIARGDGVTAPLDRAEGSAESQPTLFAAVRAQLKGLAARQAVVLLLEDLHWADPASLDLLRTTARHLAEQLVLLLATYRDDESGGRHPLHRLLPLLVRETHAHRIALRPLGPDAARDLVMRRYRLTIPDQERLVAYLQRRAEGNQLFLRELMHALEEGGCCAGTGIRGSWARSVPPPCRACCGR